MIKKYKVDIIATIFMLLNIAFAQLSSEELRVFHICFAVLALCVGMTRVIAKLLSPVDYEQGLEDMEGKANEFRELDPELQGLKSVSRAIKRAVYTLIPILIFIGLMAFFAIMFLGTYYVQMGGM